mmetsp:Transcript_12893/g.34738  ORF Transcript_12893/g.34738 Transcript_12893/m.34738 type:complete len:348 (+) Transcript_12893:467-1510(+)|eukprot:CAMPEP_0185832380 /NCGR_PEP_ID=MMETSP1353-20130828/2047_1 /TAXON_ID=1077150 /ORGANISM="Erythrolobus australicus, Strain CCMP3124" /LENGTH=347 /DNA_ID=CAMNT_0028530547 /DNA_START=355 /DNA_END=1398 /DNA_ORIENTATION=+
MEEDGKDKRASSFLSSSRKMPLRVEVSELMLSLEGAGRSQPSSARKRFSALQTPSALLEFPSWDAPPEETAGGRGETKQAAARSELEIADRSFFLTEDDIRALQKDFTSSGKREISQSTHRASIQLEPQMKRKITPDFFLQSVSSSLDRLTTDVSLIELAASNGPSRVLSRATDFSDELSVQSQTILDSNDLFENPSSLEEPASHIEQNASQQAARRQYRMQIRSIKRSQQGKTGSSSSRKDSPTAENSALGLAATEAPTRESARESTREKDNERELLRLRRNRAAAMRSREEKKQLVQRLEHSNEELTHQVSTLSAENKLLRARLQTLSALARQCGVSLPSGVLEP